MWLKMLQDLVGLTMVLTLVWYVLHLTTYKAKNDVLKQVYQTLDSLLRPIMVWLRKKLPESKVDYAPLAFIVILWFVQKTLFIAG